MLSVHIAQTAQDIAAAHAVRRRVFIEEQDCPEELEWDAWDRPGAAAVHYLACVGGSVLGTARLLLYEPGVGKITRVALIPEARGRGWGAALMRAAMVDAERRGCRELLLDAQVYAIPFYEKLGFTAEGGEFLDAGIPHRRMRRVADPRNQVSD
jgi:predicted GNAT family N-acyltransferase